MKVCPTCSRRYPDNALRCPEDNSELVDLTAKNKPRDPESLIGRRMFGDYVIERKLGEGGMGAVYLAKHKSIDQEIAIKVLHGTAAQSSELVQRFNREARTIAKLTHPNIIRVFIFGHTPENLVFLAMEYVEGGALRDLIEREGKLSELHAIYIMKQILAALAEAHDLGILHRDLKPDNILLTKYRGNPRFVKIVDFGIAKVKEPDGEPQDQLTQAGVVYGTPEYLSPEQAQAKPLDQRSDLYSLGVILWEMVIGKIPFSAKTAMAVLVQHVYEPLPDPLSVKSDLSPEMADVLRTCLQKDREQRFSSAAEFLSALEDIESAMRTRSQRKADDIDAEATQVWLPPEGFDRVVSTSRAFSSENGQVVTTQQGQDGRVFERPTAQNIERQDSTEPAAPVNKARRAVLVALIAAVVLLVALAAVTIAVITSR